MQRTYVFFRGRTFIALCLLTLCGCASTGASQQGSNPDPLEPVNRGIYKFNEVADKWVLRPAAKGYQLVLPGFVRTGVNNFFDNISYPVDILNALLQGKFSQAGQDTLRFALNSTVGLGGILDPAADAGLAQNNEDFGQTLGVWGVPDGPYIIVPLFGPRTIRSGTGDLVGLATNPQFWLFNSSVQTKVNLLWYVHTRSTLLGFDQEIEKAYDKYAFVRDSYLQNRRYLRYDGNPPDDAELFDDFEEDFDEEFDE